MAKVTVTTNEGVVVEQFNADEYDLTRGVAIAGFWLNIINGIERAQKMDDIADLRQAKAEYEESRKERFE